MFKASSYLSPLHYLSIYTLQISGYRVTLIRGSRRIFLTSEFLLVSINLLIKNVIKSKVRYLEGSTNTDSVIFIIHSCRSSDFSSSTYEKHCSRAFCIVRVSIETLFLISWSRTLIWVIVLFIAMRSFKGCTYSIESKMNPILMRA